MNSEEREPELEADNPYKAGESRRNPSPRTGWSTGEPSKNWWFTASRFGIWHMIILVAVVAIYCWLVRRDGRRDRSVHGLRR